MARPGWIGRHENLVIRGPSGTGKTFLLEAVGQAAVEVGQHVAWFTLEQQRVLDRSSTYSTTASMRNGPDWRAARSTVGEFLGSGSLHSFYPEPVGEIDEIEIRVRQI